jgi:multisubunit Na+/H+ antiporter MnhC subunit
MAGLVSVLIVGDALTAMVTGAVTPLLNDLKLIAFGLLALEIALAGLAWAGSSFIGGQAVQKAKSDLVHALIGTAIVAIAATFAQVVTTALGG